MKGDAARIQALTRRWDDGIRFVLLHGNDSAASADMAGELARSFADPANPMAVEVLTGAAVAADPQALVAAATTVSMFGDRTLVRVDGLDDDGAEAVAEILAGPPGNPVVATAGVLKKGSKLLALAEGAPAAIAVVSYEPSARDAPRLVAEIAAPFGLKPSRDAAAALFEATGGDRLLLRRELEKLALFLDASDTAPRPLELADVAALAPGAGDADSQALVLAITGGRPREVVALLSRAAVPGIVTLRAVARRLTMLLPLRALVDGGASPKTAVEGARPPVFWKEKDAVAAELAAWTTPALVAGLASVLAAERGIKAAGSYGETLADAALLELSRRAAAGRRG